MILAVDVGGTNTRVALFERQKGRLKRRAEKTYPSRDHPGLESIIQLFQQEHPGRPACASCGVAGPVRDGRGATTNLPWLVDSTRLADRLGLERVGLINDLEANAWGLPELDEDDFVELSAGSPAAAGNQAIISAGTGLGEAGLYWDGRRHHPFATEGGHADFAPRNDLEDELRRFLRDELDRVSWERVVSGPGLLNIYRFLRDTGRGVESAEVRDAMSDGDPAAAISAAALKGGSALASVTLDLFVSLYGAEAGNLALKMMATGGLFVGGGIAPKIIDRLRAGGFMSAFHAKGRMQPLLETMPVRVVLNDRTALLGAARHAESL
jgi:glucokinase